jgi:Ca2+-binding RTX toxin-like protein
LLRAACQEEACHQPFGRLHDGRSAPQNSEGNWIMGIQSTDKNETTDPGILYTLPDETWTINSGVVVSSLDNAGVFSDLSGSTLLNNGNIFAGTTFGVDFTGADSAITNNRGHSITGLTDGIVLNSDGATVTNHGRVYGIQIAGLFYDVDSKHVVLNNDGEIYGRDIGVNAFSESDGGNIHNSGLIRSDDFGIHVLTGAGLTTIIDNTAGATIKATNAAISTDVGRISLNNRGTLIGKIDCTAPNENDVIVNHGNIQGVVHLGPGSDSFNGTGGTSGKVFGEDGVDHLTGGSSADQLDGGIGGDFLTGGKGKDLLTGGGDADHFDFNTLTDSVKGANRDQILDFVRAQGDKIDLSTIDAKTHTAHNNAFHFIGAAAFHHHDGELRCAGGVIQGDVNGDGKADFEIHVNAASLVTGDFVL